MINDIWIYISPIFAAFLTYFISIKGKKKDIDFEKEKRINTVISNLLDVWNYLRKLENIADLNKHDFPLPFEIVPRMLLNSKSINDKCFQELEKSITYLKEYDPITYHKLSGIGHRFDFLKTNFILPFFDRSGDSDLNKQISETNIKDTIIEIEENLIFISKELSRKTARRIKKTMDEHLESNVEDLKEELIQNYYDFVIKIIPENHHKPTLEEFENELKTKESRELLKEQMEIFANEDLHKVMNLIAENPYDTPREIKNKIQLEASS